MFRCDKIFASMKKMLIDVSHPEETLTMIVESNNQSGNQSNNHYNNQSGSQSNSQSNNQSNRFCENGKILSIHHDYGLTKKGNIYRGIIVSIEQSLQAAFVNFGSARFGFLALDNIHPMYFKNENRHADNLKKNQVVLVQIEKEERGTKGAFLTTYISLAGRYCVLMMESRHQSGGVSRKIVDNDARQRLKDIKEALSIPEGMNVILRTAVENASEKDVKKDYAALLKLWNQILSDAEKNIAANNDMENIKIANIKTKKPILVHAEASGVLKALRDLYTDDIEKICVSNADALKEAKRIVQLFIGKKSTGKITGKDSAVGSLKVEIMKKEDKAFFSNHLFDKAIQELADMRVNLPSGGYITIHPTEALTAVDVNSSKLKNSENIDETAVRTNTEAAHAVCDHILKRNISGQVVIDFIDMYHEEDFKTVENIVKKAFAFDKARVKIQKISPLCLMEISRQRIGNSIYDWLLSHCKTCLYGGFTYNISFFARKFLRTVIHRAEYEEGKTCRLCVSKDVAIYIMHEKLNMIQNLEYDYNIQLKLDIVDDYDTNVMRMEWY